MQLKTTEFDRNNYAGIRIISDTENGLFAVQYEELDKAEAPKLEPDRSWHYDRSSQYYTLTIPQPKQREVTRTLTVLRTSTNHYEIAYADKLGCVFESVKSITTVHEILKPLWARKLQQ